jgi:hypothetical protein
MTVQISAHILLMKTEPLSETTHFGTPNLEMTLSTKLSAKSSVDRPQSGPVLKFQDRTEFLWFGPVRSGKKSDQTGLH